MGKLVIMRGVSGSGKSTRAKELIKQHVGQPTSMMEATPTAIICSADQFFVDKSSGQYKFDPKLLSQAHAYCRTRAYTAMELGVGLVVVDNTNTQKWEYEDYIKAAEGFGYEVSVEVVGQLDDASLKVYANRNQHGVGIDVIRTQAKRFTV